MRAAVLTGYGRPLEVQTNLADPVPEAGEALVRVRVAGICGGDLHRCSGAIPVDPLPSIIGHQAAGEVVAVGLREHASLVGQRCVVSPLVPCEGCPRCRSGEEHLCADVSWALTTAGFTGAYGELLEVPVGAVIPVPDALDLVEAIPMIDAFATAWTALHRTGLSVGDRALVAGVGDVGSAVLQLLVRSGIEVVAVDVAESRLRWAAELGAARTVDARDTDAVDALRAEARMDASFEVAGKTPSFSLCLEALRVGGTAVLVGANPHPVDGLNLAPFTTSGFSITRGLTLRAAWAFRREDIRHLLTLCARGLVDPLLGSQSYALEDINLALEDKREGRCLRASVLL